MLASSGSIRGPETGTADCSSSHHMLVLKCEILASWRIWSLCRHRSYFFPALEFDSLGTTTGVATKAAHVMSVAGLPSRTMFAAMPQGSLGQLHDVYTC